MLQVRARRPVRRDGAREGVPGVVLAVLVAGALEDLRVGRDDVKRLHEGLLCHLPVRWQDLCAPGLQIARFRLPVAEVVGQSAQMLGERRCLEVHVDEDPAAPGVHLHCRQSEVRAIDVWEIPVGGDAAIAAVKIPAEAMEGADEARGVALVRIA